MSHFAVYALTRNVGIDIVPLPPLRPDLQSRHSRRDIPLLSPPSEFLISRNSYKPAVLSRRRASRAAPECRARIFWQRYILCPAPGAHVERKITRPRPVLSFISD